MTLLYNVQSITKTYGAKVLFENLSLSVFSGNRIGLIGPNGSGKSTLLKILAGIEGVHSGILAPRKDLRIGYVPQMAEFPDKSPFEILMREIQDNSLLYEYEHTLLVETWLSKLGFTGTEKSAFSLSGGWKKRLSLAKALIHSPDLLLLDEPTNHLDLEGILWLEKFLLREAPTYLLVSHDRIFLQNMTNRMLEINPVYPGNLFSLDAPYLEFLKKKEEFLKGQLQQERSFASKARKELDWLRSSPKARTTKAQSRIDNAHEVLQELSEIQERNKQKRASIDFEATHRETRKLIVVKNLTKFAGERILFKNLDFTLSPGTRIGLLGPNGSGKTTLLRLIAEEIEPEQGTIKKADQLKIVYFDQHRAKIPLHTTLREALSPAGDYINFRGQSIHVNGWCKRFLFSPEILDMPIAKLSGGEGARISIAHLMLQPADVLLLDEPTNDLDISTLETLEESLIDFPGAVVLITHDRCMMDRICNSLLAFGNPEKITEHADVIQWEKSQKIEQNTGKSKEKKVAQKPSQAKLSYQEKREYEQIDEKIQTIEKEIHLLNLKLSDPENALNPQNLQEICTQIGIAETQIEQLYMRWEYLEKKLS